MRISGFLQPIEAKYDKLGLSHIIREMASRFQELGFKVRIDFSSESTFFSSRLFQAGRSVSTKTASSVTASAQSQRNQTALYVAEIKKSLNPGVSVACQIFQTAEARLKMCALISVVV
jgi:hypothetical protein